MIVGIIGTGLPNLPNQQGNIDTNITGTGYKTNTAVMVTHWLFYESRTL